MNIEYFKKLCCLSQENLKATVAKKLKKKYEEVHVEKGFVFAKGEVPILLVAHLDTVHDNLPEKFEYEDGKLSSPQGIGGDDRCGVYAILEITNKYKCSVLFCEDEEVGGHGAKAFIKHDISNGLEFNYIIELDRTNKNDAVFYNCDNDKFEKFITNGGAFKKNYGSFSDISIIAPALKIAAVNISCGYYKAHTTNEYVMPNELDYCIKNVCKLIERTTENDKFEYIEAVRSYSNYYNRYSNTNGSNYYNFEDYNDTEYYSRSSYYSRSHSHGQYSMFDEDDDYERKQHYFSILFDDDSEYGDGFYECFADSKFEAIGKFMKKYPTLCFNDIIDIEDYGTDYYNI